MGTSAAVDDSKQCMIMALSRAILEVSEALQEVQLTLDVVVRPQINQVNAAGQG